jgi:hypothetical protein
MGGRNMVSNLVVLTRVREREVFKWFCCGSLKERNHLKDLGIDRKIILRWFFRKSGEGMGWIDLSQNRARERTFVSAVMNLPVP